MNQAKLKRLIASFFSAQLICHYGKQGSYAIQSRNAHEDCLMQRLADLTAVPTIQICLALDT